MLKLIFFVKVIIILLLIQPFYLFVLLKNQGINLMLEDFLITKYLKLLYMLCLSK